MRRFLLPLCVFLLPLALWGQNNALRDAFRAAYQQHPDVPAGLLEALAFANTRMNNEVPPTDTAQLHHGPARYGYFGLVEDGRGYFENNLLTVCDVAEVDPALFKTDINTQIGAVAAYVDALCQQLGNVRTLRDAKPVVMAFCEIPDNSLVNRFCQELFAYEVFYHLHRGFETPEISIAPQALQPWDWFSANTYALVSGERLVVGNGAVNNGVVEYTYEQAPEAGEGGQPQAAAPEMSPDYPPALTVLTPCNFSSRNGVAISAVTIHTIQGSYSGCISWFQNCNASVSAHYVMRSSDGQVTQMVRESNRAWHVASENLYTVGIEHEGYVNNAAWYTQAMYTSSAALVRDIAQDYNINPTTCYNGPATAGLNLLPNSIKIKGHQHYANQTHTDPGIYWNWGSFYALVNQIAVTCVAPAGLTANNITPNSVRLTWAVANGATSYSVQYRVQNAANWTTLSTNNTSQALSGLQANTTYQWRIGTVCNGQTTYANALTFTTRAASSTACTGSITDSGNTGANYTNNENWTFTIAPTGASSVSLTFNSFGLEANYDYLYVYRGTNINAPLIGTYTGTNSPGTLNGTGGALTLRFVSDGATVSFGFSATWSCTLAPSCGTPTGLNIANIAPASASSSWAAVAGATSYDVQLKPAAGATWTTYTTAGNSFAFNGLQASTAYNWQVRAICGNAASAYSPMASFTTTAPPCDPPTSLAVGTLTTTTAALGWATVPGATAYAIQIKALNAANWSNYTSNTNTYLATGLQAATSYQWQVRTACAGAGSQYVAGTNFTTLLPACGTPSGLSATGVTYNSATLGWATVAGATGYTLQYRAAGAVNWTSVTTTNTSYSLAGLSALTTYNWQVQANCAGNNSVFVAGTNFTTLAAPCNNPTGLAATGVTHNAATLAWAVVAGATGYTVQVRISGAANWTTYTTGNTTYGLTGLTASTTYNWQVQTNCTGNNSGFVAGTNFTTTATPCSTPTGLTSSNVSTTTATVSWSAVAGATGYSVEWKPTAAGTWTTAAVTNPTRNLTGLSASTAYQYRVRTNCNGTFSAYSATGTFTTQGTCYDAYEPNNTSPTAVLTANGQSRLGKICPSGGANGDWDWFRVTINATSTIVFSLTQVPADYDLELYGGANVTFIVGSYAGGTSNETITRTNAAAGSYYYRVYGATAADFSSSLDYRIGVTVTPEAPDFTGGGAYAIEQIDAPPAEVLAAVNNRLDIPLHLFPNPAQDQLQVEWKLDAPAELVLELVSPLGEVVATQKTNAGEGSGQTQFDVQSLPAGMYLLRARTANGVGVKPVVVVR